MNYSSLFPFIQTVRDFFKEQNFMDVLTPPIVENPGMEPHIHPFQIHSPYNKKNLPLFLHTSPEFNMKKLLSLKDPHLEKIFTINYVFRDEPDSPEHRKQFIMLEWYRAHATYEVIQKDLINLVLHTKDKLPSKLIKDELQNLNEIPVVSVQNIFQEILHFDILDFLNPKDLRQKMIKDFSFIPLSNQTHSFDDLYFLLFLNTIEPEIRKMNALIIDRFPAPLAALSEICADDPRVCKRFELYLMGSEIANCYQELTNPQEQKERFEIFQKEKHSLYDYELPWPMDFMQTLQRGIPASSGIALGIERLYMALTKDQKVFWD